MIYARNASPLVPYDRKRTLGGMLHLVLFAPQIPQNTGNIGRLCALTRSRLHLIHPLGFKITDRHLKRAGMDYWYSLDVHHHADWAAFRASAAAPKRLWLFTTTTRMDWCSATKARARRRGCTKPSAKRSASRSPRRIASCARSISARRR